MDGGAVFCLTARLETIHHRITRGSPNAATRPMVAGGDPLERLRELLEEHAAAYAQAHHAVGADRTPEQVAEEVLRMFKKTVTEFGPEG